MKTIHLEMAAWITQVLMGVSSATLRNHMLDLEHFDPLFLRYDPLHVLRRIPCSALKNPLH